MNLKTLDDINKDKKDSKQKKQTNSYAGGEKSGLAIENPDDKKNIQEILSQAKETGSQEQGSKDKVNCKITLYQNGFQVNDEPFRDYSSQNNKKFIEELKQGQVPRELRQKYPNGLYVGLDDRTSDTYTPPPPPKYVAFSGSGVSLGQQQQQQQQVQHDPVTQAEAFKLNPAIQSTQVMLRLSDGQSVTLTVNLDTTVQQIYNHVRSLIKPVTGKKVILIAGFPPKPLMDLSQTVEQADLMDSEIKQSFQ